MKCVEELNIKLDSETCKVVATRVQLTFQLESSKTMVVADGLTKQQIILDLQSGAINLKKERDQAVEKYTRVRMLCFYLLYVSYIYALTFFICYYPDRPR